ncbi:hypothetical protein BESB_070690 [Besnoitia besnoiti]|uniref:Uncharacterized protein n=1 Tax=Besnoitia besnoiti TaxID=94643 RepID=A0A2A9ME63_BESBE|nr:uncharacterized protein BESB_070690 [Besnoitia besnoiti]PFH33917.1 hypothetical protein BESB_070690 [Besnoitia besnoiti]
MAAPSAVSLPCAGPCGPSFASLCEAEKGALPLSSQKTFSQLSSSGEGADGFPLLLDSQPGTQVVAGGVDAALSGSNENAPPSPSSSQGGGLPASFPSASSPPRLLLLRECESDRKADSLAPRALNPEDASRTPPPPHLSQSARKTCPSSSSFASSVAFSCGAVEARAPAALAGAQSSGGGWHLSSPSLSSPSLEEIRVRLRLSASRPQTARASAASSAALFPSSAPPASLLGAEAQPGGLGGADAPLTSPVTPTREGLFGRGSTGACSSTAASCGGRLFARSSCSSLLSASAGGASLLGYLGAGDEKAARPPLTGAASSRAFADLRLGDALPSFSQPEASSQARSARESRPRSWEPTGLGAVGERDSCGARSPEAECDVREPDRPRLWPCDSALCDGALKPPATGVLGALFGSRELQLGEHDKADLVVITQELLAYLEVVEKFRQRAVDEAHRLRQYSAELGAMLQQANQREEQSHRELARQHGVLTSCQTRIQELRNDSESAINDLTLQRDTLAERLRVTSVELEHALKENERMRLEREAQEISVRDCQNIRKAYSLVEQEKKQLQEEVESLRLQCSKSQSERNAMLAEVHHLQRALCAEEASLRDYARLGGRGGLCGDAQTDAGRLEAARVEEGREDGVEELLKELLQTKAPAEGADAHDNAVTHEKAEKLMGIFRKLRSERNEYYGYAVELLNRLDSAEQTQEATLAAALSSPGSATPVRSDGSSAGESRHADVRMDG